MPLRPLFSPEELYNLKVLNAIWLRQIQTKINKQIQHTFDNIRNRPTNDKKYMM